MNDFLVLIAVLTAVFVLLNGLKNPSTEPHETEVSIPASEGYMLDTKGREIICTFAIDGFSFKPFKSHSD
jgi:hypothetical protein